jgi:serine/threonine-protein kinase RsbW
VILAEAITLRIPAAPAYVALARLAAVEAALQSGLDHEAAEDVRLAVSEACTIALGRAGQSADLDLVFLPGVASLTVEVREPGGAPEQRDAASDEEGQGLEMIRHLTDEFDDEESVDAGSVMRFVKRASAV